MVQTRDSIDTKYIWDLSQLFSSLQAWEEAFSKLVAQKKDGVFFPKLAPRELLTAEDVKKLLEVLFATEREVDKLHTYAHHLHDEDVTHEEHKKVYERIMTLYHHLAQEVSWIRPTLLAMPEKILEDEVLDDYRQYVRKVCNAKPYTLSQDCERVMSLAGRALSTSQQAFGSFNNGDITFAPATTEKGEEKPLSHGTYSLYLQSSDRTLRKSAFTNMLSAFSAFENTLANLLAGQVDTHVFSARARGYKNALHAALTPHDIDTSVYTTLLETTRAHLDSLHSYVSLRKKMLGVDTLHSYDLHVSMVGEQEISYSYDEAVQLVIDSVAPLGEAYQSTLAKGLTTGRWVDVYETPNKRSGAYSGGCYDSPPYMLLNYTGTLRDVMTLAHEAGHSMHSYLSHKHQPYHDASYPIFVAEVASTFNEELLFNLLMDRAKNEREKAVLLNNRIDDIRATHFRQVQFAAFELAIHEMAEQGVPLTAGMLKQAYAELNKEFYGPDLHEDPEIASEFMRVPHFYYNFYVYQYATGISAAHALVETVLKSGDPSQYLAFLSSGGSKYPLDLLAKAGADMRTKEPTEKLLRHFSELTSLFAEKAC